MTSRFFGIILPIAIIATAVLTAAYLIFQIDQELTRQQAIERSQAERFEENQNKLRSALLATNIPTYRDIDTGFWYDYKDVDGNEGIAYFDLDSAARADLTDVQIQELATTIGGSELLPKESARLLDEQDLPPELQYHNELYRSAVGGTSTASIEAGLESLVKKHPTAQNLFQLSYLKELEGDYAGRDALDAQNCALFGERCGGTISLTLKGKVVDGKGEPIEGAYVEIPSRPEIKPVMTGPDGMYTVAFSVNEMEKVRLRAYKRNYSDGYADTIILSGSDAKRVLSVGKIQLESPISIVTIDYAHRTVVGSSNTFNADGSVTVHTEYSTYVIPAHAIVHESGAPYTGDRVDVYLYEFTKGNPPQNLTQLDTFDAVRGYAGDLMKTFGMPYIQFFSPDGEELHVFRSNPMQLTYTIANMDDLRSNSDKIYQALTDADMETLVAASKKKPYSIDREYLITHNMLRFPAFWVLDRKRGVWDNVGVSVLNPQGTIQTIFYTIRDM